MKNRPLYVRDLDRMRGRLKVSALDRVRLIVEAASQEVVEVGQQPTSGKLSMRMECVVCEELLEWVDSRNWWICPVCQQEITADETHDLFRVCYRALGAIVGVEDESQKKDESTGLGRWVSRLKDRYSSL